MNSHVHRGPKTLGSLLSLLVSVMAISATAAGAQAPAAKSPTLMQWETAAGGVMSFEVASVKQNKAGGKSSMNIDPTPGDFFTRTGGLYLARNVVLAEFVAFAYKLTNKQLESFEAQVPWSMSDLFDIEARAQPDTTKDQYRMMMQSLLAERFKMSVHFENRQVSLYALELANPPKFGPHLRLHRADDPICATSGAPAPAPAKDGFAADADGFPLACMGPLRMAPSAPGLFKLGGRNVAMSQFAAVLTGVGGLDRPTVDETGIKGTVEFTLEWKQNSNDAGGDTSAEAGPTFDQALKEQLGIKMVSKKGPAQFFVVDHIEHPSVN
jgi:uncharacterized protein (TIGR03435 family)